MKRYILDPTSIGKKEGESLCYMDGKNVKNKDNFFEMLSPDKEYDKNYEFDYLTPTSIFDDEDNDDLIIGDIHFWTNSEPKIYSFVVSDRFTQIIEKFNLFPNKFYNAKVLRNDKSLQFYVWHIFLNGMDVYVDFEQSTFCEWKYLNKIGNQHIKVTSEEEIDDYSFDSDWRHFGFNKAVMKPEFKDIDCCWLPNLGIVISERLKDVLEAAQPDLVGFEIIECPVEFEYL